MSVFANDPFANANTIVNPQWGQIASQSAQNVGNTLQHMADQNIQQKEAAAQRSHEQSMQNQKMISDSMQNLANRRAQSKENQTNREFQAKENQAQREFQSKQSEDYKNWVDRQAQANDELMGIPLDDYSDPKVGAEAAKANRGMLDATNMLQQIALVQATLARGRQTKDEMGMWKNIYMQKGLEANGGTAVGQGAQTPLDFLKSDLASSQPMGGSPDVTQQLAPGLLSQSKAYQRWKETAGDLSNRLDPGVVLDWAVQSGTLGQKGSSDDILGSLYAVGEMTGQSDVAELMKRYMDDFGRTAPNLESRTTLPTEMSYAADQYADKMVDAINNRLQDPQITPAQRDALNEARVKLNNAQINHARSAAGYHSINEATKQYEDYSGVDIWQAAAGPNAEAELAKAAKYWRGQVEAQRDIIDRYVSPDYLRQVARANSQYKLQTGRNLAKLKQAVRRGDTATADAVRKELEADRLALESNIDSMFPQ